MFWGLTIEPGKHYTQTVEESFHVSMAALETRDVPSPERDKVKKSQLMVQHDKAEFLVCTLCYASDIFQQQLDLNFTEGEEVTFFCEGRATIHLTGYLVRDEPLSIDPDMMSLDEASSSDEAASNSEDDKENDDEDNEDEGDEAEMFLQQLAMGDLDLEDDDDDDDIDEWKPKDGKTKRKKQQKKTNTKRQHVEEVEPRKAKKLAELEISKSGPDGEDDEDEKDDDYSPADGAMEDGENDDDDAESEESDNFIGWELDDEDDEDSEEDSEKDSEEDADALYDEEDSDYDEDVSDLETALRSLRSKNDTKTQLKTKSTVKQKRVLRVREATPPKNKMSPEKSPSKKTDAGNKENIDRLIKRHSSSPRKTDEMSAKTKNTSAAPKTPTSKTSGTSKGGTRTQAGKVTAEGDTPAVGTPGNNTEVRQSQRGKTPVQKSGLKTPSGKTTASVETPGKTPGAKAQGGSTPGKGEGKTPKGKGNEMKTPNTQKGKGDAVKTPTDKSAKKENSAKQQPQKTPKKVKLSGGTVLEDVVPGDGKVAKSGKMVFVYYRGLLPNGKEFDSCLSGKPFMFRLGKSEVIKGWDEGIAGMKVGGKRKLTIPPSQGYGHKRDGIIPANSTLIFSVELKNVK